MPPISRAGPVFLFYPDRGFHSLAPKLNPSEATFAKKDGLSFQSSNECKGKFFVFKII